MGLAVVGPKGARPSSGFGAAAARRPRSAAQSWTPPVAGALHRCAGSPRDAGAATGPPARQNPNMPGTHPA